MSDRGEVVKPARWSLNLAPGALAGTGGDTRSTPPPGTTLHDIPLNYVNVIAASAKRNLDAPKFMQNMESLITGKALNVYSSYHEFDLTTSREHQYFGFYCYLCDLKTGLLGTCLQFH